MSDVERPDTLTISDCRTSGFVGTVLDWVKGKGPDLWNCIVYRRPGTTGRLPLLSKINFPSVSRGLVGVALRQVHTPRQPWVSTFPCRSE